MRTEAIKVPLMRHIVMLCNSYGFDRDDRLALAEHILVLPRPCGSLRDLSIPELRKLKHVFEGVTFVLEMLRQNGHKMGGN